jgi:hypothetical protein
LDIFSLLIQLWSKLSKGRPTRIGNSMGFIVPKRLYKSWLNAVEFRTGMMTGRELKAMLEGYKFLDDRRIFVVIPIFEDDLVSSWERKEEGESREA